MKQVKVLIVVLNLVLVVTPTPPVEKPPVEKPPVEKPPVEKDETDSDGGSGMTAAEIKAAQDAANKARRDGKLSDLRGGGNTTASTSKPTKTFKVGDKQMSKAEIKTEYDRLRTSNPTAAREFGKKAFSATNNKPAIGTTAGGTKFERRAPTSAELRAAQAARAAGKGETGAIKAGVQQAQRQASVNAAIKSANRPSVLNKQAPTGSALRAQQDRLAQKNKVTPVKPQAPSTTGSSITPTTTTKTPNINLKKEERNSMERINGKGVQSLKDSYNSVYMERTEDKIIDEGIMDALKKVGKAVIGPADQSKEAEAARMGKRRPQNKTGKGCCCWNCE